MKEKSVARTVRRSKRQKGEDASVEPLKTQRRPRKLTGQTAEDTATDMQIGTQESALEEHPREEVVSPEKEIENEDPENEGDSPEKDGEDPEDEGEEPEDEGEELEKGDADDTQHPSESVLGEQPSESVQGEQPETKTKRRRGRTRMSKVAKNIEDKVEVEFISLGEHVGDGSVTLSSFLGPLVREHVPVLLGDWRHLDEQIKDTMWEEIQVFSHLKIVKKLSLHNF